MVAGAKARAAAARKLPDLKAKALAWLARREHSRSELGRKLLQYALEQTRPGGAAGTEPDRFAATARVETLLDWLEAQRYQSQQRFAESRVNQRSKRYGNLRILQELAQHDIDLPAEIATTLRDSEFDRARILWERKYATPTKMPVEPDKQARFLAGRGFSGDVIRRVMRLADSREPCVASPSGRVAESGEPAEGPSCSLRASASGTQRSMAGKWRANPRGKQVP
jgi:regulatory protein